jgi:serpin B
MMVKHRTPLLILSFLIVAIASCKKNSVTPLIKGKNLVLSAFEEQKVTADNVFSIKLFKNLNSTNTSNDNLFASPLSVSFALGMTSNGANSQTLDAIRNTLNFAGLTQQQVNNYYNNLITNLPLLNPNTTLKIANSIWYKQGFNVLPAFLKTNTDNFHAQVQALDFTSQSSVNTINNWVKDNTDGKIPGIIDQLDPQAVMYLVNAIYFKSSWNQKFDPAQTKPKPFYKPDGSQVQASFMTGTKDYNYNAEGNISVFELPYSDKKFSMVIVMPTDGTSLKDVITGLDSAKWQGLTQRLTAINAEISLPKFKFTYSVTLNDALKALGMQIPFSDNADFSLISTGSNLKISEVKHKAFVDIDESGTTAAAATSVGIVPTDILIPKTVIIDHPFIFAIREMSSGLILFIGTVNDPTK